MEVDNVKKQIYEFIKTLIISVIIAFFITRIISPVVIYGESMVPTFYHGERYFVNKLAYVNKSPERNDIVVFTCDKYGNKYLIKRVIAVAGDVVAIKNNELYVNNKKLNEPYINGPMITPDIDEIVLKDDEIFVMGDNRNNSSDSRHFGVIMKDDIVGKLILKNTK